MEIDRALLVEAMATHKPISGTSSICIGPGCKFMWRGSLATGAMRRGFAEHVIDMALEMAHPQAVPHTKDENIAFRKAWDAQVEAGKNQ